MKRFGEQLHNQALRLKLKASERRELRERVVSYMEYHPLPQQSITAAVPKKSAVISGPFWLVNVGAWRSLRWSAMFVLVAVFGVSYIAERAVPGDVLYAVKVRFNEEVMASLTFGPYEKVTWETERLNRRIAEARILASEGKLTGEAEESVALAVRTHSENARREIATLKETNSEEATLASMQLATTLDVQSTALRLEGEGSSATSSTAIILASVLEETKKNSDTQTSSDLPSYERLLAHLEVETTRGREFLNSVRSYTTVVEHQDITRRLEDIERAMSRAMEGSEKDNQSARETLFDSIQKAQRLIVFMANIDVRAAVNIESIVPKEFTDEERITIVRDSLLQTSKLLAVAKAKLEGLDEVPVEIRKKAEIALESVKSLTARATQTLGANDLVAAEQASKEALLLVTDTVALLNLGESRVDSDTSSSTTEASNSTVPAVEGASTSTASSGSEVASTTKVNF